MTQLFIKEVTLSRRFVVSLRQYFESKSNLKDYDYFPFKSEVLFVGMTEHLKFLKVMIARTKLNPVCLYFNLSSIKTAMIAGCFFFVILFIDLLD